jgi:hypothetical protein
MNKSGIVLQTYKNTAAIMTEDGQFIRVKIKNTMPQKGEIYSGEIYKKNPAYKHSLVAAIISFLVLLSGGMYTYYEPAAELTISINPSVQITLNRWNRIIDFTPLNDDGEKILLSLKLSNKTLDEGLILIVDQAKADNYINEEYIKSNKTISIHITEDKKGNIDLAKFEELIETKHLNMEVINATVKNQNSTDKDTQTPNNKEDNNIEKDNIRKNDSKENENQKGKEDENKVNKESNNSNPQNSNDIKTNNSKSNTEKPTPDNNKSNNSNNNSNSNSNKDAKPTQNKANDNGKKVK